MLSFVEAFCSWPTTSVDSLQPRRYSYSIPTDSYRSDQLVQYVPDREKDLLRMFQERLLKLSIVLS